MRIFFSILRIRNFPLYIFGYVCMVAALVTGILIFTTHVKVDGVNAWVKPFKFFISSGIFAWTMGWLLFYLKEKKKTTIYNWVVIIVLSFETIYISLQAARGERSHFNISTPLYDLMFALMGIAITIMTLWTLYMCYLFFRRSFPDLSPSYLWGIRLGMLFFVVFAFEGGIMAAHLSHTIGAPDGGKGLPLTNWSIKYGDLRIAHFMGIHSLQILPLIGFYFCKSAKVMILIAVIYLILICFVLVQALSGNALFAY